MPARLVVLAGVNGAGKSSVAGQALLNSGGQFYNPDLFARKLLDSNPQLAAEQANAAAWEVGRRGLEGAILNNAFFAFETTLGGKSISHALLAAARAGAEVHVSYIGLSSPELHIARVARRVAAGGHSIPVTKIRERFVSSRANLVMLMPYLASVRVYDNSVEVDPRSGKLPRPILLLHMTDGKLRAHASLGSIPNWAKPLMAAALDAAK
jgi:predicted ABC-type ATPase